MIFASQISFVVPLLLICMMIDNLPSKINNWKSIGVSDTVLDELRMVPNFQ